MVAWRRERVVRDDPQRPQGGGCLSPYAVEEVELRVRHAADVEAFHHPKVGSEDVADLAHALGALRVRAQEGGEAARGDADVRQAGEGVVFRGGRHDGGWNAVPGFRVWGFGEGLGCGHCQRVARQRGPLRVGVCGKHVRMLPDSLG